MPLMRQSRGFRLLCVPGESCLIVPLRSNAHALLTGASVTAMRRRLKYASLLYETVLLEAGVFRFHAGPGGSFGAVEHGNAGGAARWQTPAQRGADQASSFQLNVGAETSPGVPAAVTRPVLVSENTVAWQATLEPFAAEFPAGAGWFGFVRTSDPAGEAARVMREWVQADQRNPALTAAVPERFVRGAVIGNANRDLAIAAANGMAVAADPLHMQVLAQRFSDDRGWRLAGYSVRVVYPQVGDLPWEAIAGLRREPDIARFRSVLHEVERETAAKAAAGDVEAAANHAYQRHLADASGRLDGIGAAVRKTLAGIVIGGGLGTATMPIAGPLGVVVSTGAGGVVSAVTNVRDMSRQRRARGWVSVHHKIMEAVGR